MNDAIYQAVTNRIVESLERGVVPWRKPWHSGSTLPANALFNRPYRGVNVLLLSLAPYADHRWLTFQQASQLGGKVCRGEKSTTIVFWKQWEAKETDPETGEVKTRRRPLLKTFSVFNVEQCADLKVAPLQKRETLPEPKRIERAESILRSMPDPPSIGFGGRSAWYRPSDDHVQLPVLSEFDSADAFYATWGHELTHSTGHQKRLNRAGVTDEIQFGSERYSHEELVAELGSAFISAAASLDHTLLDNAASYISGWLKVLKAEPKMVVIAAAQAQRAADHIFGISRI